MCDNGKCCCVFGMICKVLLVVGGLNWGLVGVGMLMSKDLNLVEKIFGSMPTVEALVYVLVGVSAIVACFRCKKCTGGSCSSEAKMEQSM